MGKTGKWLKNLLTSKKDKEKGKFNQNSSVVTTDNPVPTTPPSILPTTPKDKKRWSFRRSSASATPTPTSTAAASKDLSSTELAIVSNTNSTAVSTAKQITIDNEDEKKKHAMAVAAATAAAADAAVAAAQAAAAVIRLTTAANERTTAIEEAAAIKIQSVFRSYLARKALCALKGLVKLQALVRGHLVRKQATATLRCMQALVTVQARARAQRLRMTDETSPDDQRQSIHRKSTQENRFRPSYHEIDRVMLEENIKIVEMDLGESKGSSKSRYSYSNHPQSQEGTEHRFATYYPSKQDNNSQVSPAASALTELSPRACSGHFEDYSFGTAQSSPQCYSAVSKPDPSRMPFAFPRQDYAESLSYDYPLFPNYMANTESSRAKVRSQSAPKSRPDSFERQPSRRRASMEGRNMIPRAMRMQRSSSQVGATAQNYHYPWSIKLDQSSASLKASECGSSSTVLTTNTNYYCKSLAGYDAHGYRYQHCNNQ